MLLNVSQARRAFIMAALLFFGAVASDVQAQSSGHGHGAHSHGANGTGHDTVRMPGLRGENATDAESEELAILFREFQSMSREVTNLPDGIRAVTTADNADLMAVLTSHVTKMIDRVHADDDPKIIIQSPTLDIFFLRGDEIVTDIDIAENAITVVQTSENSEVVAALQAHAEEVTRMVDQGMEAVHVMMMERAKN